MFEFLKRRKVPLVEDESAFSVEDHGYEKVLKYKGITYSKIKGQGIYTGEYWDYFLPLAYLSDRPNILLIGLGGGTVAFQMCALRRGSISMDVVELSKRSVELSKEFAPNTGANVMVAEGSAYVAATEKRYEVILLDAYISSQIPDQFLETGFIDNAYRALSDSGVLAINYAMNLMGVIKFNEYVRKLKQVFHVFKVNTAVFEGNVILVCSKRLDREGLLGSISQNMRRSDDNEFLFRNYSRMEEL